MGTVSDLTVMLVTTTARQVITHQPIFHSPVPSLTLCQRGNFVLPSPWAVSNQPAPDALRWTDKAQRSADVYLLTWIRVLVRLRRGQRNSSSHDGRVGKASLPSAPPLARNLPAHDRAGLACGPASWPAVLFPAPQHPSADACMPRGGRLGCLRGLLGERVESHRRGGSRAYAWDRIEGEMVLLLRLCALRQGRPPCCREQALVQRSCIAAHAMVLPLHAFARQDRCNACMKAAYISTPNPAQYRSSPSSPYLIYV